MFSMAMQKSVMSAQTKELVIMPAVLVNIMSGVALVSTIILMPVLEGAAVRDSHVVDMPIQSNAGAFSNICNTDEEGRNSSGSGSRRRSGASSCSCGSSSRDVKVAFCSGGNHYQSYSLCCCCCCCCCCCYLTTGTITPHASPPLHALVGLCKCVEANVAHGARRSLHQESLEPKPLEARKPSPEQVQIAWPLTSQGG